MGRPEILLLGLIGSGIGASRSPAMHEGEAAAHGLRCRYQLIDLAQLGLAADALPDLIIAAERMGFGGLNITHPCKHAVVPLLTSLSDEARAIGSVNTVVLDAGTRIGHNTDWLGFRRSLAEQLPGAALDRIVQLGAGGAGAATAYAVLDAGARELIIVDTIFERASSLADRMATTFARSVSAVTAGNLGGALRGAEGLIHATPAGMSGHPSLALSAALLRADVWVAEVVYFPLETELLRAARRLGCRTLDGGGMAVYQAAEAFRLFTGRPADVSRMRGFFDSADRSGGWELKR
jgi:shikimate dehydrogenase